MRHWLFVVGLGLMVGTGLGFGCAAGSRSSSGSSGDGGNGGDTTSSAGGSIGQGGSTISAGGGSAGGGGPACAKFTEEATQAPAAMLTVLDMSASMKKQQKFGTAQLAIVNAIDKDVFDSMSLGLVTFPSSFSDPPDCLCNYVCGAACDQFCIDLAFGGKGVSCGVSFLPQVAMAPAGKDKSNAAMGVRHNIYNYLTSNSPLSNDDDGSPIYDALVAAYNALKGYSVDRRIAVLITDGGFSCTSVSSPARPGYSDGACPDWEYPDTVNELITNARMDATKPINTFVVGVPGSNSIGGTVDGFATAPYKMRLALSTYAVSGAPDSVDPACDKSAVFTQAGAEPAKPCHIDLSNGASFDADALANAISDIRGKALGCVYDLPMPPPGESIDTTLVNVDVTLDGVKTTIPKRSMPADTCAAKPCWDYNAKNQVEIIGKGCTDLGAATEAKVDIVVGCMTILK